MTICLRLGCLFLVELMCCAQTQPFSDNNGSMEDLTRPATDTLAAPPPSLNNRELPTREKALQQSIQSLRDENLKMWVSSLFSSEKWWFRASNIADGLSKIGQVGTAILATASASMNQELAAPAAIMGVVTVGLSAFSIGALRTSAARARAANEFLESAHVEILPVVVPDSSVTGRTSN